MPTVQELRAAMGSSVAPSEVRVRARAGKPGRGASVEPYDGPMGTDNRIRESKAGDPDDTYDSPLFTPRAKPRP